MDESISAGVTTRCTRLIAMPSHTDRIVLGNKLRKTRGFILPDALGGSTAFPYRVLVLCSFPIASMHIADLQLIEMLVLV